jgi:cytochrome b involved in lipid metabolism
MIISFLIVFVIMAFGLYYKYFFTKDEEKHIEKDDRIIVTFGDGKYDITDFLDEHPGGRNVLIKKNGKDIEKAMKDNNHSADAYSILEKYRIN